MSNVRSGPAPESPSYRLLPMTKEDAVAISAWEYPPPSRAYHLQFWRKFAQDGEFSIETIVEDPAFRSVKCGQELCGFAQFFRLVGEDGNLVVRLGLGLHPRLCGLGLGAEFVRFLAQSAVQEYPGCSVDLEVACDNLRAIRAYQRAGFDIVDEYTLPDAESGSVAVYCMEWKNIYE